MLDVFVDALLDTLKIMPFILVIYILIEVMEHKLGNRYVKGKMLGGKLAPFAGATLGLVPQCGFSVVATNLYVERHVTLGTLLAVYIATSDEAIPILIGNYEHALKLLPLLGIKLVLAIIVGYSTDLIFSRKKSQVEQSTTTDDSEDKTTPPPTKDTAKPQVEGEAPTMEQVAQHDEATTQKTVSGCCGHKLIGKKNLETFLLHPIFHTLKITLYILIVNFVLGTVIYFVGEERLTAFLRTVSYAQPFVAALVGLIPNCSSSVLIAQLYAIGGLNLGAAVAGLSVNAGIATAVLFKQNKNLKQNLLILLSLFLISSITGLIVELIASCI